MVIFDRDFHFRIENCVKKSFQHSKIESRKFAFFSRKKSIFRKRQKSIQSRCRLIPIVNWWCFMVIFYRDFRFRIENRTKKSFENEKFESRNFAFFRAKNRFFENRRKKMFNRGVRRLLRADEHVPE